MTDLQVVAHCLLNPQTRVKGLAPVEFSPTKPLIQLPCPEAIYMGLDRWAATKDQLDIPAFRRFCREIFAPYADLIEELATKKVKITIVGVTKSPSCAIRTTSVGFQGGKIRAQDHQHMPGMGVFMEEVTGELVRRGVSFEAVDAGASVSAP